MTKLEDVIHTEEYGDIEIWSQDDMEYFFQDKMPQDESEFTRRKYGKMDSH